MASGSTLGEGQLVIVPGWTISLCPCPAPRTATDMVLVTESLHCPCSQIAGHEIEPQPQLCSHGPRCLMPPTLCAARQGTSTVHLRGMEVGALSAMRDNVVWHHVSLFVMLLSMCRVPPFYLLRCEPHCIVICSGVNHCIVEALPPTIVWLLSDCKSV